MKKTFTIAVLCSLVITANVYAQCGTDPVSGVRTISSPQQILNSYFPGTGSPGTGTFTLTVGALDSRGDNTPLAEGDLIMIMQMQGADIDASNGDNYGNGVGGSVASGYLTTNLVAGNYEYNTVSAVAGSLVTVSFALVNSYHTRDFSSGPIQRYQVIRIPRQFDLVIDAGASVTAPYWNGSTGGVVILDAANVLTVAGSINVNGLGFRGGGGFQLTGAVSGNTNGSGVLTNTDYRWNSIQTTSENQTGGAKGEGIAGTPVYVFNPGTVVTTTNSVEGYLNGTMGRGAPGNAGGGATDGDPISVNGNQYNTGGGGGGNGGAGGQGGSGWHGGTGNVTSYATGGYGGAAFAEHNITKFIMGGGGGAGAANNSTAADQYMSSGASGGGIVLLRAGSFSGTGSLLANGVAAVGILGSGSHTDAAGGGGAGGTIIAVTRTTVPTGLSGITVSAIGGNGGNSETHFDHGPGGGGGGGVIISNGTFASTTVAGGTNGFTRAVSASDPVDNAFGSTSGTAGTLITLAGAPILKNADFAASPCGVLPVKLISFTAALNRSATVLNWEVSESINFAGFDIEFSSDGSRFAVVGDISYKANENRYQFTHNEIAKEINYYRLKLKDQNGAFTYSKTLTIKNNMVARDLVVYPQPAGSYTTVQVHAAGNQNVTVQMINASGTKVAEKRIQLHTGNNVFLLDNLGYMPAGIYSIRMLIDGKLRSAKLMIGTK
jgi:hypothetical protein